MDLIFRDRPMPPPFNLGQLIFRYGKTQLYKIVEELSYQSANNKTHYAFSISIKLQYYFCRLLSVTAESLIKINKHIHAYDSPYILPLVKPIRKGSKHRSFPKVFSDYNISIRCIYENV